MKKKIICLFLILISVLLSSFTIFTANATTLSDNLNEQLVNLDLSKLEEFYNEVINNDIQNISLKDKLLSLIKGEYNTNYNNIFEILFGNLINSVKHYTPIVLSIIVISLFITIISNIKSSYLSQSTTKIINIVGSITIILILYKELYSSYIISKNAIENIAKLNEIMSPIILTIMVAIGSNASASIYSPQTMLLSSIITNIFLKVILPLVIVMTIISIAQDLSGTNNLGSFIEFITSLIKWVIGISFTIFAIFITTQGLTASTFDSASIRATKYAISNSIPLVGGFLKDGFDVMIAGSVLIKNALGIVSIITMASFIISPVIKMLSFSLMIKLATAIINTVSNNNITSNLKNVSKCISYFNISTIICGFMYFLTILLSILTANAFI